ncbi:hypothetical protein A2U01_0045129, partial [Trifolium medium]|nr:hypothetical protein [Trifolium medium]
MVAIGEAIEAQNYLKEMMKKYPSSQAIKECATSAYNEVVSEFKGVVIEDPEMEDLVVQYANDGIRMCETALANEKIVNVSSIYTLNNNIKFLIGILQRGAQ